MVTKKCTDCPRQADHDRRLCWHCTNLKKRYGMTDPGIVASRREAGVICYVCDRSKADLRKVYGRTLCRCCRVALQAMEAPGKLELVSNLLTQKIV